MLFNFADVHEAIAAAVPEREALVWRDRRLTYEQLASRSRRLAFYLNQRGIGLHTERAHLAGHESGQDHVALYLYNGNEYVEGMLGAFKARAASLNVNYRYVEEELHYLFDNSQCRALIYHSAFAERVASIRDRLPRLEVLIQVQDESGAALLPGAVDYEEALASVPDERPPVTPSPDDLYILYTGGTTGMPKGVLWRSDDIFVSAMGGRGPDGQAFPSLEAITEAAINGPAVKSLCGPPLMHCAAQWMAFNMFRMGATVVIPGVVEKFDAKDYLETIVREGCMTATIVGDAFAAPLIDELDRGHYDLSGLFVLSSGGAPLSALNKQKLLDRLPHITVMDGLGSSETGFQASNASTQGGEVTTGDFRPAPGSCVVSADLDRLLEPGDESVGWFAQTGRVPLGYLGDAEKTARTFPVIDGVRYSVPGDRASVREDGSFDIFGRDSVTINSGGEKIFAEEVEAAIKHHPDVYDAVVAGRDSERWGQEVVAIVRLREGRSKDSGEIVASLSAEAALHIARYKLPKAYVFREVIERSPSGKADYRWAKAQAIAAAE